LSCAAGTPAACGPTRQLGSAPAALPSATSGSRTNSGSLVVAAPKRRDLILATTTSTQDSGLLDHLVPRFEKQTGYQVKTVSVGTGAALQLGARGEADVVLVHAPESEVPWMTEGNGTERLLVMHNDFVILAPPGDPAGTAGQTKAVAALENIGARGALWISRDDDSGTDQIEKKLWSQTSVASKGQSWYITVGQGVGSTLTLADQKDAYTLAARATYLVRRAQLGLQITVEGDPALLNIYHVMPVNPAKFPGVELNVAGGQDFARWLVSRETQRVIGEFGKAQYGQPLFFPDAGKREDELAP
jgi:tungstate transport system substrate-binding protein